jgi:hypothetical protein
MRERERESGVGAEDGRQAEKEAEEAQRRAAQETARRLAAAGFYPVEQAKAREAAAAAAARKIAAKEAQEVLDRIRREEEAEKEAAGTGVTSAVPPVLSAVTIKTLALGKGLALSALNFLSEQLSKSEPVSRPETYTLARPETPKPEATWKQADAAQTAPTPPQRRTMAADEDRAETPEEEAAVAPANEAPALEVFVILSLSCILYLAS